ncbi:MAG TPA: MarR family transcriptional regulator [Longimicrobiales bacterium]|nr:MarR family transcriptional regulator [Longimicrobiales bacterium]
MRSFRAADDVAMNALRSAGFRGTGPSAWYLLRSIPPTGGRASTLARELGVTKQAVGQTLKELEREGYVEKETDPADGRALCVRPTPEGLAVALRGEKALLAQERSWEQYLGRRRLHALREGMEAFADFLEEERR